MKKDVLVLHAPRTRAMSDVTCEKTTKRKTRAGRYHTRTEAKRNERVKKAITGKRILRETTVVRLEAWFNSMVALHNLDRTRYRPIYKDGCPQLVKIKGHNKVRA